MDPPGSTQLSPKQQANVQEIIIVHRVVNVNINNGGPNGLSLSGGEEDVTRLAF